MLESSPRFLNSIFVRIMLMLMLMFIPVYGVALLVYHWGTETVQEELAGSMKSQVDHFMQGFEKDIQRIQTLQFDVLSDENLSSLATVQESMNEYERTKAILRLQQRLIAIKNSSASISSVIAYIPSSGLFVSSEAIDPKDGSAAILREMTSKRAPISFQNGTIYLSAQFPIPSSVNRRSPLYKVLVLLDSRQIENQLKQISTQKDSSAILVGDQGAFVLADDVRQPVFAFLKKNALLSNSESPPGDPPIHFEGKRYLKYTAISRDGRLSVTKYVSEDRVFEQLHKYALWLWLFTGIVVLIVAMVFVSAYRSIHRPLIRLVRSFRKVESGNFNIRVEHHKNDEFKYLFNGFNLMVDNLRALIDQVYKERILAQRSELKHLQAQINPHFLYNCFFILYNMVEAEDYENVRVMTKQLGSYFQFITRSGPEDIPLRKEVDHARVYANIQMRRFRKRIRVDFQELPDALGEVLVPRLIVQPLLENVFEHGLANKLSGGMVRVTFGQLDKGIFISVEDNGEEFGTVELSRLEQQLRMPADDQKSNGLLNIHRRIELKFGGTSGLAVFHSELGGLHAQIRIQL